MSIISLQPINSVSDYFRFSFVVHETLTFDFSKQTGDILLHISVRQPENKVVLNTRIEDRWEDEIPIEYDFDSKTACLLTIEITNGFTSIALDSVPLFSGQWRYDLADADRVILSSDSVQVRRETPAFSEKLVRENQSANHGSVLPVSAGTPASPMPAFGEVVSLLEQRFNKLDDMFQAFVADKTAAPTPDTAQVLEVQFSDRGALRLHKDVAIQGEYLVTRQEGSTPGFRHDLVDRNIRVGRISLLGLESDAANLIMLLTNEAGAIVETHRFAGPRQPTTVSFDVETDASIAKIFVCFAQPKQGERFRFEKLVLESRIAAPIVERRHGSKGAGVPRPNYNKAAQRAAGIASIPLRVEGLEKVVDKIGEQVDELHVYLNAYGSIPAFLQGKRQIKVYQSEDFDNRGDAGKFFGFKRSRADFYLTVDDDIAYPKDYADRLVDACARYSAPSGVHGSLMRFPIGGYYDLAGRYVFHFRDKNEMDRRVHILGTGTLCFAREHISPRLSLRYPNMADIWFARYAAESRMPLTCIKRDFGWMQPIELAEDASIFSGNSDGVSVQALCVDSEVQKFSGDLPSIKSKKPKVVVAIKTYNRKEYLTECIDSIVKTVSPEYDPVIIVADDGSEDGTVDYLMQLRLPVELHVLTHHRAYVAGQTNAIFRRFLELNGDFLFVIDDDVVFKKEGWMRAYYDAAHQSGYHHLCHLNLPHYEQLCARRKEAFPPPARTHSQYPLVSYGTVENCMGALFTVTREVIEKVGWADEVNFFVRGLWHIDFSARCCRAGFNEYHRFFDIAGSNDYIVLQNTLKEEYKTSIGWQTDDFKRASSPEERQRRWRVVRTETRIHVSHTEAVSGLMLNPLEGAAAPVVHKVNDVFDKVFVINLDRRPDRLAAIGSRLQAHGISFERVPAVDGTSEEVRSEWQKYCQRWSAPSRPPMSSKDFVFNYQSDRQRVASLEKSLGGPAFRTPGAWAYSKTYLAILRRSLQEGYERILVLDDDGVLHKHFGLYFDKAVRQLPVGWKVLQLGTMQYDWGWTTPYSENLYMPNGVVVGSHAVGYHADTLPLAIECAERWTLPYDIGPLHYVTREFMEESFVITPNLIIQDTSKSDINSSEVADSEKGKAENVYRWSLVEYE